jgi:hypothetical protein
MTASPDDASTLPPAIDGRVAFQRAIIWGFKAALESDARQVVCVDPSFADWPLDDAELLQSLTAWLRLPQRRLVLLAANFDHVPRGLPRFNAWRRNWSHAIEGWQPPDAMAVELPTLLVADRILTVRLIDPVYWRGRASLDQRDARVQSQEIDAVLQRCERAFAVNSLGL